MKEQIINAAIQVLPGESMKKAYEIIDHAIDIIAGSGLKYRVCPFETVVEGSFNEIYKLLREIRDASYKAGAEDLIINLKLQMGKNKDILIDDKMSKYE